MKKLFYIVAIFFTSIFFIACTKYTPVSTTIDPVVVIGDTAPTIKFFDAMNFGSMDVTLNNVKVASIARTFASPYITAKEGTNFVKLQFPGKTVLVNAAIDLVRNTKYSCFFYMVGNEWKYNIIKDDLNNKSIAGFASVRVLDFRPEAYYNYMNIRIQNTATSIDRIDQANRNFLDHVTYSGYSYFSNVIPAGNYKISLYDSFTYYQNTHEFKGNGIYSVILNTMRDNVTPYSNAVKYIVPDVVKHN